MRFIRTAPALVAALLIGLAALAACEGPLPEVGLESGDPIAAGLPDLWRPLDEGLLPQRRVPPVEPRPLEHAPDSNRVVILGLDGADWRMLEPMIQAGLLPNLEMLLAGGAAGVLKTDFAYSPTSWTTIATGRVPAVHGVTPDKQRAWFAINVEPQEIKVRRIWEIAREAGKTIAVYDFFFCRIRPAGDWGWIPHVPPWEPNELPSGLNVQGCPVPSGDSVLQHLYLKACLLARRPTDLTLILAIETDAAGHLGNLAWLRRWRPALFVDDPAVPPPPAEDPLSRAWKEVDAALGLIWRDRPPGSHLIICSDHGFGVPQASHYQALIGAGALEALGLDRRMLEDQDQPIRIAGRLGRMSVARRWEFFSLPVAHFQGRDRPEQAWLAAERLIVRGPRWGNAAWRQQVEDALAEELGADRELLKLTSLDSRTLLLAPDVEKMGRFLSRRQTDAESQAVNASFQSGDHHAGDDGIILIAGPKVRPGALIDNARLVDVTPTALYLLGLPVARDLDGRVLSEALDERALRPPIQYVDTYEKTPVQRDPLMLDGTGIDDPGVDPQLVERLRSLGYLQ